MAEQGVFNNVLVPTDFSNAAEAAFEWAVKSVDGSESLIILLHVVDEAIIDTIERHDFAPRLHFQSFNLEKERPWPAQP